MFRRLDQEDLLVTSGLDAPVFRVPLQPFSFVSTIRWCGHRQELILTAAPTGRRVPDLQTNDRGDLRLFRCDPRDGVWQQVYRGYAHDPVCLPDGGYVIHRGAGLTMLDGQGAVVREVKVGRFNWGPPSLSVSPTGDTIAWVRWNGDDRRLCVETVGSERSTQFRTRIFQYAWLNPHTLLYIHGARPRLLDIASGDTRRFGQGLRNHVRRGVAEATAQLQALAELPADQLWEFCGDLQVVGDDVWYSATLTERSGSRRVDGLFRATPDGNDLSLVATMSPNDRIEGLFALPDRSALILVATYEGTTIVDRSQLAVGPRADFLASGWFPLLASDRADFGFHRLPGSPTDAGQ
ncbi:hypothetical protein [Micromonospora sp. NPDC005161]